jgi:glucose/arabinose dehydrogenase
MGSRRRGAVWAFLAVATPALAQDAPRSPTPQEVPRPARATDVAVSLEHPWGLAVLPDGRLLVTERPGRLRLVAREGRLSERPEIWSLGHRNVQAATLDARTAVTVEHGAATSSWARSSPAASSGSGSATDVSRTRSDT